MVHEFRVPPLKGLTKTPNKESQEICRIYQE